MWYRDMQPDNDIRGLGKCKHMMHYTSTGMKDGAQAWHWKLTAMNNSPMVS